MDNDQWQAYIIKKLDHLEKSVTNVRIDVAGLKGRAAVWGAVSGLIGASILTYLLR